MEDELFAIGVVIGARGLRGELRIKPLTDHPNRFNELKTIILHKSGKTLHYAIQQVRFFKNLVLVQLEGVGTREEAEKLAGFELLVGSDELVVLDTDEYFWFDLIGMEVFTGDGQRIGTIVKIIDGPANDVYVVDSDGKEHLVPAIRQVITQIDIGNNRMVIDPIPGLIDNGYV